LPLEILKIGMKKVLSIFAIALLLASCNHKKEVKLIDAANFNTTVDGKQVSLYTLHNGFLTMQVTNYGGRVVALWMPDRRGSYEDIVLGYDHIDKYLNNSGERYLGAVVGRCANRISNGTFTLNGVEYQLPKNDGENTLHGGLIGADKMVWDVVSTNDSVLQMHALFPDGLDGFPGSLDVTMTYTLTHDNQFQISYKATTDAPTLCNFSHHSFFNLRGEGNGTILDHELQINSRYMTVINDKLVTTGKFSGVKNTPFDFREKHAIGQHINEVD
jgi:aldose 1-epimerase